MRRVFLAGLLFFLAASGYAQNTYPPLIRTVTYAGLGTSANNGTIRYCRDCDATSPCAGSGVGAFALRVNGAWECTSSGGAGSLTSSDGSIVILGSDLTVDDSAFKRYLTGTGAAPGTCTPGTDYIRTDTNQFFPCTSDNTFVQAVTHEQDSIAGADWFIDEDSFATNSATRVPSQQSVKAYVDASAGGGANFATTVEFTDEFFYGGALASQVNWTEVAYALQAAEAATCPGTGFSAGCFAITNPAQDNGGSAWRSSMFEDFTSGDWSLSGRFQLSSVTSMGVYVGALFHATAGSRTPLLADNCIWIRYDTDNSDANFTAQVGDAAGAAGCQSADDDTDSAIVDITVAAAADAWFTWSIAMDQTGVGGNPTITFTVNATSKTLCSSGCDDVLADMPATTAIMQPFFACGTRDATGVEICYFDSYKITATR